MGRLEARVRKLESARSTKRYVWCEANPGETVQDAVRRHARELGIGPAEIGCAVVFTEYAIECIDFGGRAGAHTLLGYMSYEEQLELLAADDSGACGNN
jgi:hypothetical protein